MLHRIGLSSCRWSHRNAGCCGKEHVPHTHIFFPEVFGPIGLQAVRSGAGWKLSRSWWSSRHWAAASEMQIQCNRGLTLLPVLSIFLRATWLEEVGPSWYSRWDHLWMGRRSVPESQVDWAPSPYSLVLSTTQFLHQALLMKSPDDGKLELELRYQCDWSEDLTHWQRTPHRSVFPAAAAKVRWSSEEEVFGQNCPPQAVCKRAPWPSKWWVSSPGSKWLWHCCPSLTSPYVGLPEPAVLEESHHDFKGQHSGHSCSWCKKVDATI